MKLVLVESPTKVPKIQKYLDELSPKTYRVASTVGHWRGLPSMSGKEFTDIVDTVTWRERFEVQNPRAASAIRAHLKTGGEIVLALDDDREGEAIAWHIVDEFRLKNPVRLLCTEITKPGLKKALANATQLNEPLAQAARARAILDYLVGMELSRMLWRFGAKSAGRVQSAALRIVVTREQDIVDFKPKSFWNVFAEYKEGIKATVGVYEGPTPEELDDNPDLDPAKTLRPKKFTTKGEAEAIVAAARGVEHSVSQVQRSPLHTRPRPPYTTTALQSDCASRFDWSAKKTAELSQALFSAGHITYIRTDSVTLSDEAIEMIRGYVKEKEPDLLPPSPQIYKDKGGAQAAHEAIRPTSMMTSTELGLTGDEKTLYSAIFERAFLCQCKSATKEKTTVVITPAGQDFRFMVNGTVIVDPGWLRLDSTRSQPKGREKTLPALREGQTLAVNKVAAKGGKTSPKPRFTSASLILYLERKGIGRPATIAGIMAVLFDRKYVKKAKKKLHPTELGTLADKLTRGSFEYLTQEGFTAATEKSFDKIAKGKLDRKAFLSNFYTKFTESLADANAFLDYYAKSHPELDRDLAREHEAPCPACGGKMLVRNGKYGQYAQCDSKECGKTLDLTPLKTLKETCPKCSGVIVIQPYMDKKTKKKKKFYRCSDCTWKDSGKPTAHKCPDCDAGVVEQEYKKGGKKRVFFRCSVCEWKDSLAPPTVSKWPCHANAEHGPMLEFSGTTKAGKPFTFWRCKKCSDAKPDDEKAGQVWSGPKPPSCPDCGQPMRGRESAKGKFWGCSAYPDCRGMLQHE